MRLMGFEIQKSLLDNEYLRLENKEYERRHGKTIVKKWLHTLKIYNTRKYVGREICFNEVKQLIDEYDIISFDIFDTLLKRPYDRPTDLFYDIEMKERIPGFAVNRINAEKEARDRYSECEDITLKQIYQEVQEKYKPFMEKELKYELEKTEANDIVLPIFKYAVKRQKQIIIISDMYLHSSFLKKMLEINGIVGFSKLYVSSETMKTKTSGNMYAHVLRNIQKGKKVLHIGDNLYSDGNALYKYNFGFICIDNTKYILIERRKSNA